MRDGDQGRFEEHVLEALGERADIVTRRWLDELTARLPEQPRRIFPTQTLLNDIPELLRRLIRSVLEGTHPKDDAFVERELTRLARLRRDQGYGVAELLLEFQLLVALLFEALLEGVSEWSDPVEPERVIRLAHRMHRALLTLSESTARVLEQDTRSESLGRAALLSSFGRAVNHELRNRLNAARLTLDAYRASSGSASEDLLENLDASLRRIEDVSRDIFSVVLAQGRPAAPGRRQPLDQLVADVVGALEELAQAQEVAIRVSGEIPDIPVDAARVQLALSNLLINAIKYSDASKQERWVELRAIKDEEEDTWRLEVEDNGVGIPPELRQQIFEPAVRGESSPQRIEGEGLGLSLAREAVSQLGGRMWVARSSPGGTTFSFTLREPPTA